MAKAAPTKKAPINTWKPKGDDEVSVESDGQKFIVHFEKYFGAQGEKLRKFDEFIVKKTSFEENLAINTGYINYFINNFDDDNELIMGYLKIKYMMDEKKLFTLDTFQYLVDCLYGYFITDSLCEKIKRMVDANYIDNVETDDRPYKSSSKYMKSLEFDNQHIKIILRIAMAMKMLCPIVYHYLLINKIRPTQVTQKQGENIIYYIYKPLFDVLTDPGVNIFNKLYVYVESKVNDAAYHNEKTFEQREILGDTSVLVIERFIKAKLIVDNMLKFNFNKVWNAKTGRFAENPLGLTKTIIKQQLWYYRKETYGKTFTEMPNTRNSDGLSTSDKMEMNLTKVDVGILHMADIITDEAVEELQKKIDVPISDLELQYYLKNLTPSRIQIQLIRSVFADFFSSYRIESLIGRKVYITMALILKKRLLLMGGCTSSKFHSTIWLPYIITGNMAGKESNKLIRDATVMDMITNDPIYKYLTTDKYRELEEKEPGAIMSIIMSVVNTKFTYVIYENEDLLGQPIEAPVLDLAAEMLFLLKMM